MPDVLVMTATPIPRTAAMTVYGDLDVSVLDESARPGRRRSSPPGRGRPRTRRPRCGRTCGARWRPGARPTSSCPLIEESEKLEVRSAEETYDALRGRRAGRACGSGLLHGRMTPAEKEATMDLFRAGRLDVLVATTVIEVGVDVPNATVMVDPRRRPLRHRPAPPAAGPGRPGRATQSWCYLVGDGDTPDGEARLEAMVRTHRRLRAGRGRPRPAGRGHDHGRAAEGPQRPQAGVAAPGPGVGGAGPGGGVRHRRRQGGRRRGRRWRRPGGPPRPRRRRSACSSTRTTRTSCSRADRAGSHARLSWTSITAPGPRSSAGPQPQARTPGRPPGGRGHHRPATSGRRG